MNEYEENYLKFWPEVFEGLTYYCIDDFDNEIYLKGNHEARIENEENFS